MAQLKLSADLVSRLQKVIEEQDEAARDPAVALQYLAASTGYLLATVNAPPGEKREFLQQLGGFSEHVLEDVLKQQQPQQEAFGIWRPDKG